MTTRNNTTQATVEALRGSVADFERHTGVKAGDLRKKGGARGSVSGIGGAEENARKLRDEADRIEADNHDLLRNNNELQSQLVDLVSSVGRVPVLRPCAVQPVCGYFAARTSVQCDHFDKRLPTAQHCCCVPSPSLTSPRLASRYLRSCLLYTSPSPRDRG